MKYTDRELDRLLEKLIASTRSPRGKFSAAASYQILEKRLRVRHFASSLYAPCRQ